MSISGETRGSDSVEVEEIPTGTASLTLGDREDLDERRCLYGRLLYQCLFG